MKDQQKSPAAGGAEAWIRTDQVVEWGLHPVQEPAHRLAQEEIVPRVRYRVSQQGWHRAAEPAVEYRTE